MRKWEYKVVNYDPSESDINKLGAEGWELVAVSDSKCYFKRPKS
jgi:hypothetical protein